MDKKDDIDNKKDISNKENLDLNKLDNNTDNNKTAQKKKIIPAYQRKNEPVDKKKKKVDKKTIKSRITIAFIVAIVLIIGFAIWGVISLINYNKYKPYKKYEETMKIYGFDTAYNNQSAKTGESVTKSEAIKVILSAALNLSDISNFAEQPEENYDNAIWVEYAKYKEIIGSDEINKDNANDKVSYIDVIRYLANAKVKIVGKELDSAVNMKVKDIDKYKTDEQTAIEDMISNEIITINTKKIKGNSHIFKGQLNELISNFAVKYNTITENDEKINISEDKEPSNKDQYPYTLASVDKKIYEIEDYVCIENQYKNAKEVYKNKKEYYSQISTYINDYFSAILNIDYNTINADELAEKIKPYMLYGIDRDEIKKYVEYVKDNKIILSGTSKVNLPAVYYDGRLYRVRTTIEVDFSKCNTNKNLFFGDDPEDDIEYDTSKNTFILDVPIGDSIDDYDFNLSIFNGSIKKWIAGQIELEY